jgi:exodeoxyribonuclease (lambda-induced)
MIAKASNAEQGSYEWLKSRIGYVTASDVAAVMAKGSGATRQNYMVKMLCEMLSGEPTKGYKSKNMQDGNDNEPVARSIYEKITGNSVKQLGFYYIEDERIGASTDGEVDDDGIIEIKSVIPAEQVRLLTTGKIKDAYIKQMQTQMYVLEKQWCDFTSVSLGDEENGELPNRYKVKIIRVARDEDMILRIRKEVAFFHYDLQELIKKLEGQSNGR